MTAPGGAPRRCGAAPVELTPSAELQRLMRAWRERLELRGAPSPNRPLRPTQDDLARLVGVSSTWYRSLERGIPANYSDEFLDRVADVLQLDAGDRQLLYLLAAGRLPPPLARPPGTPITDTMANLVHAHPWPSYIVDTAWDVLVHNQAMTRWFPNLPQTGNIMRLAFCDAETRQRLVDFNRDWLPALLGQMRAALARWPANTRLTQLITDILAAHPHAQRLWRQPTVRLHPDGDRRRLCLPDDPQPRRIEIMAFTPMRADDLRIVVLQPLDDMPAD